MPQSIVIYFEPREDGDIKERLKRLSKKSGSLYAGRSTSQIGKMLLLEKLKELDGREDDKAYDSKLGRAS